MNKQMQIQIKFILSEEYKIEIEDAEIAAKKSNFNQLLWMGNHKNKLPKQAKCSNIKSTTLPQTL